jgi:hypothetical protein
VLQKNGELVEKRSVILLTITALTISIATATPALAVIASSNETGSVEQTIYTETGEYASLVTVPQTAVSAPQTDGSIDTVSVGVGHDSTGAVLPTYAQDHSGSVRMIAVVPSASKSTVTYNLNLPTGAELTPQDDGTVAVTRPIPSSTIPVDTDPADAGTHYNQLLGTISPAWAVDAVGHSLATSYSTGTDGLVTQTVDTTGATFPVVADPLFSFGFGIYINLVGVVLKGLVAAFYIAIGGGIAVACAGVPKLKSPLAGIVRSLCFVFGSASVTSIITNVVGLFKITAIQNTFCYQKRILPNIGGFVHIASYKCF